MLSAQDPWRIVLEQSKDAERGREIERCTGKGSGLLSSAGAAEAPAMALSGIISRIGP